MPATAIITRVMGLRHPRMKSTMGNSTAKLIDATDIKRTVNRMVTKIAKQMDDEANIESLIVAKGFEQCVAVLNDESASIVVKAEGELTAAQLSQINEIVYVQAGIIPENITIIQK